MDTTAIFVLLFFFTAASIISPVHRWCGTGTEHPEACGFLALHAPDYYSANDPALQDFFCNFLLLSRVFLPERRPSGTRQTKTVQISLHKDDILADAPDAFPRNDKVLVLAEQTKAAAGHGDDDRHDPPAVHVHFHVRDKAQAVPIAGVDDLAAAQAGKTVTN